MTERTAERPLPAWAATAGNELERGEARAAPSVQAPDRPALQDSAALLALGLRGLLTIAELGQVDAEDVRPLYNAAVALYDGLASPPPERVSAGEDA